ncbi:protein TolQ [Sphingomonas naphthae]|uniref:Protein TolQ n=1 Tax=Sphingomonas naphthae TaxID=1813468 RepID=A0ABY7TIC5_9SPHN|nr:protein TolQ [Sphingomonas naphthae]WCT72477.1 protein TolQ [Sphingomonas naphthae]
MELINGVQVAASHDILSPVNLFMQADIIVKAVMILLVVASVWTWAIIIGHGSRIGRMAKKSEAFEQEVRASNNIDALYDGPGRQDLPAARVFTAGVAEWRRSTGGKTIDREGSRSRIATALGSAVAAEIDKLGDKLNMLATIGSVGPFVGLFGTVWGIMRAFTDISASQNTSLGVVAPGIAEALFATALGLFAAIPAVIAYNRLSHKLNKLEARLTRFADNFHSTLSKALEE